MKKPETLDEESMLQNIYKHDTDRYIDIATDWISKNPNDDDAYFMRHRGWMKLGNVTQALDDINSALALKPDLYTFWARGELWRRVKNYRLALTDLDHAESLDRAGWQEHAVGLLFQADCHAHLGDEASALACCARLPDDFWTPGINGAPSGGKDVLPDKLRAIAAAARAGANKPRC